MTMTSRQRDFHRVSRRATLLGRLFASFISLTATSNALSLSAAAPKPKAIVVGAGPVGVAAALTLSSSPHNYDVTLLESAPEISSQYDPSKAFLYNVNLRGQALTSKFPRMQKKLEERGVPSGGFGGVELRPLHGAEVSGGAEGKTIAEVLVGRLGDGEHVARRLRDAARVEVGQFQAVVLHGGHCLRRLESRAATWPL